MTKSTSARPQVVYAIGSSEHAHVKIGTTTNIGSRLSALQTSSPFHLRVLWQQEGGYALERFLHARLSSFQVHGEWFDFEGADAVTLISETARKFHPLAAPKKAARPPRMTEPRAGGDRVPGPVRSAVETFVAEIRAIADPAERGAAATEALQAVKEGNVAASQIRHASVCALKDQGLTLKEIGAQIGSEGRPLHYTRIQQILKGQPTGRWAKAAREATKGDDADE